MPREKEGFRDQLERLDHIFPGKETLKIEEAATLLGVYRATLLHDKTFPVKKVGESQKNMVASTLSLRWRWPGGLPSCCPRLPAPLLYRPGIIKNQRMERRRSL